MPRIGLLLATAAILGSAHDIPVLPFRPSSIPEPAPPHDPGPQAAEAAKARAAERRRRRAKRLRREVEAGGWR